MSTSDSQKTTYLGINIDYSRDSLFDESGLQRLKAGYMTDTETSPQERFAFVSKTFSSNPEHAQRLYDYASKMWLSYATPILSYGKTKKSLPISCFADGTVVQCKDGLKKIEDIKEGDLVLSSDGEYHKVVWTKESLSDDVYELTIGEEVFFVTGNHLVLTKAGEWVRVDALDPDLHEIAQILDVPQYIYTKWEFVMQFSIKKVSGSFNVHDIEVEDSHNFTVGKGKFVVHNCFASLLGDSMESILATSSETRMLAVVGGGVGLHVNLRPGDKKSSGIIPHLKTYDVDTLAFKQGTTRRGATAAYLNISHPEIIEFLEMRKPTGGDPNRKCLNLHHGINVSDDFMRRVEQLSTNPNLSKKEREELDKWDLINEYSGKVVETVSVRELWERILTIRHETGEPYLLFIDECNARLPKFQKNLGLKVNGSNLCIEITEATKDSSDGTPARTFVCCLSSPNLERYDEWKDNPLFISDIVEMLDNVITVFIEQGGQYEELSAAVYSAMQERSIGIGSLGWHSLLQKRGIPFESALAVSLNNQIWSKMKTQAVEATLRLAQERGPCPDAMKGSGPDAPMPRNAHLFALAPNASTAYILDTSPSCETLRANAFLEKGVNGTVMHRNKYLERLLETKGKNTKEVWTDIIANDGSVQALDFLTDYEKDIYKTGMEVDQTWVIQHAADRQKYICQSQSTNLFFRPDASVEYLHLVHLMAWQQGMKSLYYLRSDTNKKADKVGKKVERQRIEDLKEMAANAAAGEETYLACEG